VLVAGGTRGDHLNDVLFGAELYDPQTGNWTLVSNMTYARVYHTASIVLNETVLVAGGYDFVADVTLSSAELYYL
jgi:hypothetical protein